MTNTRNLTLILCALLFTLSCQRGDKQEDENTQDDAQQVTPDNNDRLAEIDRMVTNLSNAAGLSRSTADYSSLQATGSLAIASEAGQPRILAFEGTAQDEETELQRKLYLGGEGRVRFYRSMQIMANCDDGSDSPCARETKVYLDENGNPFAIYQRQKLLDATNDVAMSNTPFSELYDYDQYKQQIQTYRQEFVQAIEGDQATSASTSTQKNSSGSRKAPEASRIPFQSGGNINVSGSVTGTESDNYLLRLQGGEKITLTVNSENPALRFMVFNDNNQRIGMSTQDKSWTGTIPSTGDYRVQVFMNQANDARSQPGPYKLNIKGK